MKTILITDEEDRAAIHHKDDPDINQFSNIVRQKVEIADYWIHVMPMSLKLMMSRDQLLLPEIRELIAMKVVL